MFSTIAFSIKSLNGLSAISGIIAFLLGTGLNFIAIIPFFLLCRKYGYCSILEFSYRFWGKFSYLVALLLLVITLSVSISTVVVFEDFLSDTVLKDSSSVVVISLLVFATAYGAFLGIEALGRFANLVFVLLCISILAILLFVAKDIQLINLGSFSFKNTVDILKTAIEGLLANTGLLSALLLTPIVNQKHSKGFAVWNVVSLVLVELITFSVTGVLGEYANSKEYPYYSTATIAEFSIFKRLDIIYMCVWIFVAFIKTCYYLLLSKSVLDTFLSTSLRRYSLMFCSIIVFLTSLIANLRPMIYGHIKSFLYSGISTAILVILPLLFLFAGGKEHENN